MTDWQWKESQISVHGKPEPRIKWHKIPGHPLMWLAEREWSCQVAPRLPGTACFKEEFDADNSSHCIPLSLLCLTFLFHCFFLITPSYLLCYFSPISWYHKLKLHLITNYDIMTHAHTFIHLHARTHNHNSLFHYLGLSLFICVSIYFSLLFILFTMCCCFNVCFGYDKLLYPVAICSLCPPTPSLGSLFPPSVRSWPG